MYRQRFGLTHHPLPKDAKGKTFFDQSPGQDRLQRSFNGCASSEEPPTRNGTGAYVD